MKYCSRCLYPANHPLGITFDEDGVCSGCRVHEEKDSLNWDERAKGLKKIFETFRSKNGKSYDCIIPVSGARDSYYIVHVVKNIYKMHPLLVTYNKHYNTEAGIRNLAYLKILFGCDIMTLTVAPQTVKKITSATIRRLGSIYWHCIAGQTVYPVQIATRFKIPLIVWGAHQGCDQVGMYSHLDEVEMTRKYRKDHDLMGLEAEDLINKEDGICESDIRPYKYPHDKEIEVVGVRGIYLNNYIRWDSKKQHELMIKMYGYESLAQYRTFDTYNDVDCFHYSNLHDYIKLIKCGYGKVTDHACREIRLKRLTREEGIALVSAYQNKPIDGNNLHLFLNWLGMSEDEFCKYIDIKRKSHLIDSVENHINDAGIDKVRLIKKEKCEFINTGPKVVGDKNDKYTLIGKGYVEHSA